MCGPIHSQAPSRPVREMFAIGISDLESPLVLRYRDAEWAITCLAAMAIKPRPTRVRPPIGEQTWGSTSTESTTADLSTVFSSRTWA